MQFGNYVESPRRQADLNRAYDSLHDLADVLNVPTKALSLNGRLGLAFGARGKGKAAAHYEPGEVAINLTKGNGPGALATNGSIHWIIILVVMMFPLTGRSRQVATI